jgi:hypothetical protein
MVQQHSSWTNYWTYTYHILPQVIATQFLNITVQPAPHYSNIVTEWTVQLLLTIQGVSGGIVNILEGGSMDYSTSISTTIENGTHVYMNIFTRNSPYYHLLKYLLFLLKHPVYDHNNKVPEQNVQFLLHFTFSMLLIQLHYCLPPVFQLRL